MFSYIHLSRFKNFSNLEVDFTGGYGEPKKLVVIYGENGAGKTNLLQSINFLSQSFGTLLNQQRLEQINLKKQDSINDLLNEDLAQQLIQSILKEQFITLEGLINKYKMLNSTEPMDLEFGFRINNHNGLYSVSFNHGEVVEERLRYVLNSRIGEYFRISPREIYLSPSVFRGQFAQEIHEEIRKYWGKHTLLSIIFKEVEEKNRQYIVEQLGDNFETLLDWFKYLTVWCKGFSTETAHIAVPFRFMKNLEQGRIKRDNMHELELCQDALNHFFTSLYSDIKLVSYHIEDAGDKVKYQLCFSKQIDGELLEVPVSQESTGTRKLLEIFPVLFASCAGKTVVVDEIDSGIHDLLMEEVLKSLIESISGQLIITTHNTLLMRSLSPENIYIIREDYDGRKQIRPISDSELRIQRNNNIQHRYFRGDYGGTPYVGDFDLGEIVDETMERYHASMHGTAGEEP